MEFSSQHHLQCCNLDLWKEGTQELRFEGKNSRLETVINAKRGALVRFSLDPSQQYLRVLKAARDKDQQTTRRCTSDYWLHLSSSIQLASINGNTTNM